MKKKLTPYLISVALIFLVSSFMPLLLFFNNVEAISFLEVLVFMGTFSGIGLILFAILRFFNKSTYKSATITAVVTLIYQNIGRLEGLIGPWFVILLFTALMVGLGILTKKHLKDTTAKTFTRIFAITLAVLCLFNTVTTLDRISAKSKTGVKVDLAVSEQMLYLSEGKGEPKEDKLPNIYFFLPDEYAGFNSAQKFLDYDNTEFKNFLETNNFKVSTTSTNYSSGTMECMADVFNLEINEKNRYKNSSEAYCKQKTANGAFFRMLEDLGYNVRAFQPIDLINYESESSQTGKFWSTNADGELSVELMLKPTLLYPLRDAGLQLLNLFTGGTSVGGDLIKDLATANAEPLVYFTKDDAEYPDNTFTFCYGLIPHNPYYYDAQGNLIETNTEHNNVETPKNYLDQYKYTTTLLTESVENIIKNDPDSIIILMSDHGLRIKEGAADTWMKDMTPKDNADILCAVYYKGEEFADIEGLCGANVMITLMNEVYGYNIPAIPQSDEFYFSK